MAALAAFAERAVLGREAVGGASVELIVSGYSMRPCGEVKGRARIQNSGIKRTTLTSPNRTV